MPKPVVILIAIFTVLAGLFAITNFKKPVESVGKKPVESVEEEKNGWLHSIQEGKKLAEKTQKVVLVKVGEKW